MKVGSHCNMKVGLHCNMKVGSHCNMKVGSYCNMKVGLHCNMHCGMGHLICEMVVDEWVQEKVIRGPGILSKEFHLIESIYFFSQSYDMILTSSSHSKYMLLCFEDSFKNMFKKCPFHQLEGSAKPQNKIS